MRMAMEQLDNGQIGIQRLSSILKAFSLYFYQNSSWKLYLFAVRSQYVVNLFGIRIKYDAFWYLFK